MKYTYCFNQVNSDFGSLKSSSFMLPLKTLLLHNACVLPGKYCGFMCYPGTACEFMQVLVPLGMQLMNVASVHHLLPEHFMADCHRDE